VSAQEPTNPSDPEFVSYSLDSLIDQLHASGKPWLPFFKGQNVLTGLYTLKTGAEDRQQPHDTDEVYYVVSGKARFVAGTSDQSVEAGDILYVKAEVEHRFYEIEEVLVLLVFFDQ
jgi:mannose-6-phosphate isomerase-like protein (cupin superfamily)